MKLGGTYVDEPPVEVGPSSRRELSENLAMPVSMQASLEPEPIYQLYALGKRVETDQ